MIEFGRINRFDDELDYKDINELNRRYSEDRKEKISLNKIKMHLVKNTQDQKSMSFDEFIKTFFPEDFAKSFVEDFNSFDRSMFMNNDSKGKRAFITFASTFRFRKFSIPQKVGTVVPPPEEDGETTRNNMVSFVRDTINNTENYFKNHKPIDSEKFIELIKRCYNRLYIFNTFESVIEHLKTGKSALIKDERLESAFYTMLTINPYEAFARMLLTIALEIYLFPQRKNNKGNFTDPFGIKINPQLALNVLWFTYRDGSDIMDAKNSFSDSKEDSFGNELDREKKDVLNLSLANICLSQGKIEDAYNLLKNFNDNRSAEESAKSEVHLKGLLKYAECAHIYKDIYVANDILDKYSSYDPTGASYYYYKFWKNDTKIIKMPSVGKNYLEKSVECGNENAIMDLAKAYIEGDSALDCEKDLQEAFNLLDEHLKNGQIKKAKGYCYSLLGKICAEDPSLGNSDEYLEQAKENGYDVESFFLNRKKKAEKKEIRKPCVDFYYTNSESGANLYFKETLDTEKAQKINADFNLDAFRDAILQSSDTSLVAAFLSDDQDENNIYGCIEFIKHLDRLNYELTNEEVSARKAEISRAESELSRCLEALKTPKNKKAKEFIEKITGIRNVIKNSQNIKLGQSFMFRNLIKETDMFSKELGEQAENFKKIFAEYEKMFALPDKTKKLIESVRIFVKGDSEYATAMIDTQLNALDDNLYFRIKVVDYALASARELISERPVFAPYYENGEKNTQVVIFGSGSVTERIITEILGSTVMGSKFSPSVAVFDNDVTQTENNIKGTCIALYNNPHENFNIKMPEFFSFPLNHPLMQNFVSNKSAEHENEKMDKVLRNGNYYIVATESDKFNIEFAKKIRGWLLRSENAFDRTPTIAVLVKNSVAANAAESLEVGSHFSGNSWYNNYNLFFFGQEKKIYSAHTLINDISEKTAEYIHCSYCLSEYDTEVFSESDFVHENLTSFYRNSYNHDSSLSTALSLQYRLFAAGHRLNEIKDYYTDNKYALLSEKAEVFKSYSRPKLDILAEIEHSRWCSFMISRSWQKATKQEFVNYMRLGVPKQQCFICKLHPYIVDWSLLDEVNDELTKMTTDQFAKDKLKCPKNYDTNSLVYTADFLKNYDLFANFKKKQKAE